MSKSFVAGVVGVLWCAGALATTVVRAPLSELAAGADVIIHGRVSQVDERLAKSDAGPFRTAIDLEISEVIKGLKPGALELRLQLPGGVSATRQMRIPGMPRFAVGDEVVLLLERTAQGFALAGLSQGVYKVDRSITTPIAIRNLDGVNLMHKPTPGAAGIDLGNTPSLEHLLSTLRTLVAGGQP